MAWLTISKVSHIQTPTPSLANRAHENDSKTRETRYVKAENGFRRSPHSQNWLENNLQNGLKTTLVLYSECPYCRRHGLLMTQQRNGTLAS